jgi:cyclase
MILVVRDRVAALVAQGETLDEVFAAHPTADYDARVAESKRPIASSERSARNSEPTNERP